jgi:adenosylmethionine-8-amino-7-oxononanoate aminotransferase
MAGPQALDRYRFTAQPDDPPLVVRAEGVELITADGRRILDAAGGAVVNNIGHGRVEVADAMAAALRRLDYVVPIWPTPNRLELADLLVERWTPEGFGHVFFAGGGSEANDTAMRLVRTFHLVNGDERRCKVIGRVPSYHGATLATLAIGGHAQRRAGFEPLMPEHPKVPWDDAGALAGAIEAAGPDTVAAFIAEPVIGASGAALIASADYWASVGAICREYGVLVIADEVMTGFGRTGLDWGHLHDGLAPDVIVSAKGVGGGYAPLSLVTASDRVVDPITAAGKNVMFFTFSGPDASCAGALAVLRIIEREGLVERSAKQGAKLLEQLQREVGDHPNVVEVRGRGLMVGVELTGLTSASVVGEALRDDVWIYPAGSGPTVNDGLLFAPPLIVEDDHLDRIVDVTRRAIEAVAARAGSHLGPSSRR